MPICQNKKYEREYVNMMTAKGIFCTRIAGSGSGKEAVCDCISFIDGKTNLVEVKATKEKVFYVRKNVREQLDLLKKTALQNNAIPILAIKFKQRGWNNIQLEDELPNKIQYIAIN